MTEVRIAHPGAICPVAGETAVSKNGTPLYCRLPPSNPNAPHKRWGAVNPRAAKTGRRRGGPRKGQGLEKRYVDQLTLEHDAPLPKHLVEQLNDTQIGALRRAGGLDSDAKRARKTDVDKLQRAGLLTDDGKLTTRGLDALRSRDQISHTRLDQSFDAQPAPAVAKGQPVDRSADAGVDRSADAGVDWSQYLDCRECGSVTGAPCADLSSPGSFNAYPHDGRLRRASEPATEPATTEQAPVTPEAPKVETAAPATPDQVRSDLNGMDSADAAREYVDNLNLNRAELKKLADGLGIAVPSNATKGEMARQIVHWTVGRRLASQAISRPVLRDVNPDGQTSGSATAAAVDRSADAGTDWSKYRACPTCGTGPGEPCLDLSGDGSFNATAHDGRPTVAPAEEPTAQAAPAGTGAAPTRVPWWRYGDCPTCHTAVASPCTGDFGTAAAAPHPGRPVVNHDTDGEDTTGMDPDARRQEVSDRVRDVLEEMSRNPAYDNLDYKWISLARLRKQVRDRFGGRFSRAEVDEALRNMMDQGVLDLEPEANQKTLTDDTRSAAMRIGGENRHLVALEPNRAPVDRSADAGTDWLRYGDCPACAAGAGQPCHDLGSPGSLNAVAHDGRPTLASAPASGGEPLPTVDDDRQAEREADRDLADRFTEMASDPSPAAGVAPVTPEEAAAAYDQCRGKSDADLGRVPDDVLAAALQHPSDGFSRDQLVDEAVRRATPVDPNADVVDGHRSATPELPNNWGTGQGEISFHGDGITGRGLNRMGTDRLMDIDGEPLANVAGRIATRVVRCQTTPEKASEEMRQLRDRTPPGSAARRGMDVIVEGMGCPQTPPPPLADDVPEPIRQLMHDLHTQYPIVRRDGRETAKIAEIVADWERGDRRSTGMGLISRFEHEVAGAHHESDSDRGRIAIDQRVLRCIKELEALRKADRRSLYPPQR